MADIKLKYLEHLGKEKHFNRSVEEAVRTAQDIPKRVAVETSAQRAGTFGFSQNVVIFKCIGT